jgi:hypothetical protein
MTTCYGFFYIKPMKPILNTISLWFGVIMILLITAGAIAIALTDLLSERLYGNKRIFFVLLLLAYAVYRSFRIYHLFKKSRAND